MISALKNVLRIFISSCSSQYFDFSGRSNRKEFVIFSVGSCFVSSLPLSSLAESHYLALLTMVMDLFLIIPSMAVTTRRLHDIDRSGWYILLAALLFMVFHFYLKSHGAGKYVIVIYYWSIYIILCLPLLFLKGTPGPNKYGEQPE